MKSRGSKPNVIRVLALYGMSPHHIRGGFADVLAYHSCGSNASGLIKASRSRLACPRMDEKTSEA